MNCGHGCFRFVLCLLGAFGLATSALAEKRVALVIGNSAYQNTPALANPVNDAEDVATTVSRLGFTVVLERNLDRRGMETAIARFARLSQDADAAMFYYAGHGVQADGVNYLIPVDAEIEAQSDLDANYQAVKSATYAFNK